MNADTSSLRMQEGYPHQRVVVVPANVLERCRKLPMVQTLHPTHIGSFPSAPHHYVERDAGATQAILIYCISGSGLLQLNQTEFTIKCGQVALIPPRTPHIYRADDHDPWSIFWVHFDGAETNQVLQALELDVLNPTLHVPDITIMRKAFEDLYACLNYHYSDAGLLAMTSELLRLLSKIKLHYSHPHRTRQKIESRIMETIVFMQQHLDKPLALTDLATRAGQSVPHYCKLFKQRTSQSPMAYFIQLKVIKACDLLGHTDQNIREIARELGYDDPYYFSRLFKKVQGCSPSAYRTSIKS